MLFVLGPWSVESRAISLYISKAFDRVWLTGLLAHLPMFDLHHTLIKWIASFLSDRSIAIRVDGLPQGISGIPQGSIMSPILFIVFINGLISSTLSSIYFFADMILV